MASLICACGCADTQPVLVTYRVGEETEEYWCDNCIAELETQYPAPEEVPQPQEQPDEADEDPQ